MLLVVMASAGAMLVLKLFVADPLAASAVAQGRMQTI